MLIEKFSSPQKCKIQCEDCDVVREVQRSKAVLDKAEHPCQSCSNKRNGITKTGKYTAWNSGNRSVVRESDRTRYVNSHGYVEVWCGRGEGTKGRKDGYKLEHRLVMEEKLGRDLLPGEIVHHVDGNKTNNLQTNLTLCDNFGHHRDLHTQLENVSFDLLMNGFIIWDELTQTYSSPLLKKEDING